MITKYMLIFALNVLFAACAQVLLKTSANKKYDRKIKEYLNPYVLTGYSIFVINTMVTIYCYTGLELKQGGILQMLSYIYVLILGRIFLKEKITARKFIGMIIIMAGIVVFYL
jgi:drug/metabolite transporter (DMT)-like permease